MLSEGDEADARQRWTSSLMNLQRSTSTTLPPVHSHLYHTYQPPLTGYTDCSRTIPDLTGYTSATAGFSGHRYVAGDSRYNIISSAAGGPHGSTERFRLQHDLWGETISGRIGAYPSCVMLSIFLIINLKYSRRHRYACYVHDTLLVKDCELYLLF